MTNNKKIFPHTISSDTLSQLSKNRASSAVLRMQNVTDVPTSTQEEEENSMEQLARLERRMKVSKLGSGVRSLKCLMFAGVLALIIGALCLSFVWFAVFLSTMISFGDSVRENTFQQLRSNVQAEIHRMTVAATSISSSTTGFEPTTSMDTMRDAIISTQFSLQDQFEYIGVSFFPMNMRGAFVATNLLNPNTPDIVGGIAEFKAPGAPVGMQQYFSLDRTTRASQFSAKYPAFLSLSMPPDFVEHVKVMNHPRPVAFTRPVPSFCMINETIPALEDGFCVLNLFKVWSHQMYSNASLGVQSSVLLITTTDAFSDMLTQSTRPDSMSYVLTMDSKLIAVSRGLDRIHEDEKKWRLYKYNATDPENSPLISATEYPDEMVSSSAAAIMDRYGSQLTDDAFGVEPQTLSVADYIVDYQVIQLSSNVDESIEDYYSRDPVLFSAEIYLRRLVLVHVIPNDAFTRTSINTGIIVIVLASLASVLSFMIVIIVSCCINRPVRKLICQMNSAKDLDLDKIDVSRFTYFSELREIQSMFFFLVLNLKQYQSFLPAHVLQMIEARRLSHSDKHKSKKKQRHDANTCKLTTVEDEMHSESSQDNHSQTRSFFGSVTSASRKSKSDRLSHQFTLGMFRRNITVLRVHIVNMRSMLRCVSLEDIVNQHSQLVDVISKLVGVTHSATLSSFTQDSFFIALNATISSSDHAKRAARLAVHLKRRIELLNERFVQHALEPFQIVISIASGESIVSTLGTTAQKQQVIFDSAVDHAKIQTKVTTMLLNSGIIKTQGLDGSGVAVVLDQNTMGCLPKKHIQSRIIDVIAVKQMTRTGEGSDGGQWKFHYLFELQDINMEGAKAQEWMYSLKDEISEERLTERNQRMTKAWTLLVADEAQEANRMLTQSDESDSPKHETAEEHAMAHYREMDISGSNQENKMSVTKEVLHTRLATLAEHVSTECAGSLEHYCEERLQSMQFSKDQLWASLVSSVRPEMEED